MAFVGMDANRERTGMYLQRANRGFGWAHRYLARYTTLHTRSKYVPVCSAPTSLWEMVCRCRIPGSTTTADVTTAPNFVFAAFASRDAGTEFTGMYLQRAALRHSGGVPGYRSFCMRWKALIRPLVEPSKPSGALCDSRASSTLLPSFLPSSTPHWSNEFTSQSMPCAATLCS